METVICLSFYLFSKLDSLTDRQMDILPGISSVSNCRSSLVLLRSTDEVSAIEKFDFCKSVSVSTGPWWQNRHLEPSPEFSDSTNGSSLTTTTSETRVPTSTTAKSLLGSNCRRAITSSFRPPSSPTRPASSWFEFTPEKVSNCQNWSEKWKAEQSLLKSNFVNGGLKLT